jgi:hypothetical protein
MSMYYFDQVNHPSPTLPPEAEREPLAPLIWRACPDYFGRVRGRLNFERINNLQLVKK